MSDFILDCGSCGVTNPEEARFCKKCGAPLKEKTFLFHIKRYIILISVISICGTVLTSIFFWFYSNVHEPTTTQLTNNVRQFIPKQGKQTIIGEKCIDSGYGYYCSPLQKELIEKHPETYESIEAKCRDFASNYDSIQTVDYNYGDEKTAYDLAFSECIRKANVSIKSTFITKHERNKNSLRYSLSIISSPKSSRIRILNIKPKYHNGIKLKKGKYLIEISATGYETLKKWINLTKNNSFSFSLKSKPTLVRRNIANLQLQKNSNIRETQSTKPLVSNNSLSIQEKRMIEDVCNGEKILRGSVAYYKCMKGMKGKKRELSGVRPTKFNGVTTPERKMIEDVCNGEKILRGPAAYYKCMEGKKRELSGVRPTKFNGVTTLERKMIEDVCNGEKILRGPAAYYKCMEGKKRELSDASL